MANYYIEIVLKEHKGIEPFSSVYLAGCLTNRRMLFYLWRWRDLHPRLNNIL